MSKWEIMLEMPFYVIVEAVCSLPIAFDEVSHTDYSAKLIVDVLKFLVTHLRANVLSQVKILKISIHSHQFTLPNGELVYYPLLYLLPYSFLMLL